MPGSTRLSHSQHCAERFGWLELTLEQISQQWRYIVKDQCVLRLYVANSSEHSIKAVRNLKRLIENTQGYQCVLKIIDVLEDPEEAEKARILATPALIRVTPLPERRIIGDLSDQDTVLDILGLEADDAVR